MSDCPFCRDEFLKLSFLQDEHFLAVPNRAPILNGHSMIVTRRHIKSVFELTHREAAALFPFIQKVGQILSGAYQTDAFDYSLQDGEAAGQTVYHFHLHVIPRHNNDLSSPGAWFGRLYGYDDSLEIDSARRLVLSWDDLLKISETLKNVYNQKFDQ